MPVRLAAHLAVGVGLGTVPDVGLVGALGVAIGYRRLRVEASFLYGLPSSRDLGGGAGGGGRFDLLAGSLDGCALLLRGLLSPRVCGGLEAGSLQGSAYGVSSPGSGSAPWLAARAGAALAWAPSPGPGLRLWLALFGIVPVERPVFVVEGRGPVYRPAAVSGRASLGVELRFR